MSLPQVVKNRWHELLYHCGISTDSRSDSTTQRLVEQLLDHPTPWRREDGVETLLDVARHLDETLYQQLAWKAMPTALRRSIDAFESDVDLARNILDRLVRFHGQQDWQRDNTGLNPLHLLVQNLGQVNQADDSSSSVAFLVQRATRVMEILIRAGVDPQATVVAEDAYPGRYQFADVLDLACWLEDQQGAGAAAITALLNCGVDERLVLKLKTTGPKARARIAQHPRVRAQGLLQVAALARQMASS